MITTNIKRPSHRAFIHADCETGIYHVVSRVVERRLAFGPEEKQQFVETILCSS